MLLADVPSLPIDDLDGYPPEPEYGEDRTCEHGSEEPFRDSDGRNRLMRLRESNLFAERWATNSPKKSTRQSPARNTRDRPPPPRVLSPHR